MKLGPIAGLGTGVDDGGWWPSTFSRLMELPLVVSMLAKKLKTLHWVMTLKTLLWVIERCLGRLGVRPSGPPPVVYANDRDQGQRLKSAVA